MEEDDLMVWMPLSQGSWEMSELFGKELLDVWFFTLLPFPPFIFDSIFPFSPFPFSPLPFSFPPFFDQHTNLNNLHKIVTKSQSNGMFYFWMTSFLKPFPLWWVGIQHCRYQELSQQGTYPSLTLCWWCTNNEGIANSSNIGEHFFFFLLSFLLILFHPFCFSFSSLVLCFLLLSMLRHSSKSFSVFFFKAGSFLAWLHDLILPLIIKIIDWYLEYQSREMGFQVTLKRRKILSGFEYLFLCILTFLYLTLRFPSFLSFFILFLPLGSLHLNKPFSLVPFLNYQNIWVGDPIILWSMKVKSFLPSFFAFWCE